jgi:branched-chain amino acid transport system ATP-binding protein/urea transport system ATP-binding protein
MDIACPFSNTKPRKRIGGVALVDGVNFALRRERIALSYWTQRWRAHSSRCSLAVRPTHGRILLEGEDIVGVEPYAIGRRGVGIKNQVPVVMNGLTVRENLWLAARARRKGAAIAAAIDAIIERLDIGAILGRFVGELAHGQRQWIEIAMVIVCEPNIVLLDEPRRA